MALVAVLQPQAVQNDDHILKNWQLIVNALIL